jgi:tRNA-splicing ligase RtcB
MEAHQENLDTSQNQPQFQKITNYLWELPMGYRQGMRVPVRIFGTQSMIEQMDRAVFDQISNVATLPGIMKYAFCMPDGHSGYGFPIGGVAAMDTKSGVISPGGIGFDINCGMRLMTTNLSYEEVKPRLKLLVDRLFESVPAGVGSHGLVSLSPAEFMDVAAHGAQWCLKKGYATLEDLELTEDRGQSLGADPTKVSETAIERGRSQLGTLGSGNHYLEIQVVKSENLFEPETAKKCGITFPDQVVVMFHCGSRGFGHQVASDYLKRFLSVMGKKYKINIIDRELASAPFESSDGQDYFGAMKCAINVSFANRQMILHRIREVFSEVFKKDPESLGLHQVYDIAHNTAKVEQHRVDGHLKELLVHRKGATRAFGPEMNELPEKYREMGQPVILGGSMETGSYLMVGALSGEQAFFSTAHGSGRVMSRTHAKREFRGSVLAQEMRERGIYVKSVSFSGLAEEAGKAYKDIDEVARVAEMAGLCRRVVKLIPVGNVKG